MYLSIHSLCIRNLRLFPNQPWLGDRFLNHVQLWPAHVTRCSERGMVSGLMLCHLDAWGSVNGWWWNPFQVQMMAWQCQCFIKGQMTCCRGRQWHCLVPEAFRCSFTMFRLENMSISEFPLLLTESSPKTSFWLPSKLLRGCCFFLDLNPPFPSKDTSTLRSNTVVYLEVC